jgi:hypothetical protein
LVVYESPLILAISSSPLNKITVSSTLAAKKVPTASVKTVGLSSEDDYFV